MKELYEKIYIKSEADLPKNGTMCIVHCKWGIIEDKGLPYTTLEFHLHPKDIEVWLTYIDWYLQPMEQYASQRMPSEEKIKKAMLNTIRCTITEDAEDINENYYFQWDDVIKIVKKVYNEMDR